MNTTSRILIVEDEPKVAGIIKAGLEENHYLVSVESNGLEALRVIKSRDFDLIILDINLPGMNGYDLCKEIRQFNKELPVIMLTALGSTDEKVTGFDAGADDYIVKPFEFRELLARIKAMLKRTLLVSEPREVLKLANLEVDFRSKQVKRGNKVISLTAREFNLLEYLLRNRGRVISRVDIAEKIWDIKFDTGTNVIDVYINFLRKKIDKDFEPKLIHTIVGMGYVLKEPEDQ
jgi:two-component system, OmpR family, copper resistance phosphate regulon response regulator CusR